MGLVAAGEENQIEALTRDVLCITIKGKPITPKTIGQIKYI